MIARRIAAALVAALAVSPGARAADQPYEIHVIATMTGISAFVGKYMKLNFDAFEEWANGNGGIKGRPLHFVYDDDQSQPQVAVQLATEVLGSHPTALMVTGPVANCAAVAPLLGDGPVMWCNSPALHPKAGSFAFASGPDTLDGVNAVLRYYLAHGWTELGILNPTDVTGQDADRAIAADLKLPENAKFQVVAYEHFNPTDLTVSAQLERIKAGGAQALIAWSTGSPVATVFKGMIQAGLDDLTVAPTAGNEVFQQLEQYQSFLPKHLIMASALVPAARRHRHARSPGREGAARDVCGPGQARPQGRQQHLRYLGRGTHHFERPARARPRRQARTAPPLEPEPEGFRRDQRALRLRPVSRSRPVARHLGARDLRSRGAGRAALALGQQDRRRPARHGQVTD